MKKTRIIAGVAAAIVAASLCTLVCVEWIRQGASVSSLVAAVVFYTTMTAGLWLFIDQQIRERAKR